MTDMRREGQAKVTSDADRAAVPPAERPLPPTPPPPGPVDDTPSYETGGIRLALLIAATVAVGLLWGWPLLVMILGLVVTIFFHELGHYVTARRAGMKCTEFFIGFGPKIWSFRRGETEYGFKVIPGGAYVRIVGMNNLDEVDPADEGRTYREQSFPKRLLVVSAGSLSHLAQAFVIGVVLFGLVGMPGGSLTEPSYDGFDVERVEPDTAAEDAGFEVDDRIVAVDGASTSGTDGLSDLLAGYDVGDDLAITVERGGDEVVLDATLGPRPKKFSESESDVGSPFLGVTAPGVLSDEPVGLGPAIVETPGHMWDITTASLAALGGVFSPSGLSDFADSLANATDDGASSGSGSGSGSQASSSDDGGREGGLMSIIGFVRIGTVDTEYRAALILSLFFQINLLLAFVNMLPLPPLDGGHAALAIYERIRSRRGRRYHADFAKLLPLTYAVFLVLVVVGISTMYLDVVNPIGP